MKTLLLTGASGDIGLGITKLFLQNGYQVIGIYHNNFTPLAELSKTEPNLVCLSCNLSKTEEVATLYQQIEKQYNIDCLINCAGVSLIKQIQDCTEQDYNFIFDNNFKSMFNLTKLVAKTMIGNKYGKIVNISSMWGKVGASCESLYSASKGAVNSFTLALAKELAPSNINVNAICPGVIDSKMNACFDQNTLLDLKTSTPLNRLGTPQDIAELCLLLCEDKSSFITGQIITIDGGFSL